MKPTYTRFALLMVAGILLAGCASQKKSPGTDARLIAADATYRQAAEALAAQRFTIELDEVFLPSGKWANINNSFISMQGSLAEIEFSQELLHHKQSEFGSNLQLTDGDASLKRTGEKKNKYTEYTLFVQDHQRYMLRSYRMRIRLFADSDRCDIQAFYTIQGEPAFTVRGRVIPMPPEPATGSLR